MQKLNYAPKDLRPSNQGQEQTLHLSKAQAPLLLKNMACSCYAHRS